VPVTTARLEPDGRRLHLELAEVQPGFVHELTVAPAVTSVGGTASPTTPSTASSTARPSQLRRNSSPRRKPRWGRAIRGPARNCTACTARRATARTARAHWRRAPRITLGPEACAPGRTQSSRKLSPRVDSRSRRR
jgi:hypothetical protein